MAATILLPLFAAAGLWLVWSWALPFIRELGWALVKLDSKGEG